MKKKLLVMLLAVSMVMSLCACGSKEEKTEAAPEATAVGVVSTKDYNPDEYVTVGDYSALEVEVDVVNFTEEDVKNKLQEEIDYYVDAYDLYDYKPSDKTVVESGDVVNIDYVGKKDGVAFDGGTAQGHNLEIGSGSFIAGFEDGLIGATVGEKVDLNLTFPEEYHSEELAGAAVVFEVTVNSINTKAEPEVTDELVAKFGTGVSTIAELEESIRSYLQETCDETNTTEKEMAVWSAVYELCTVNDPPQAMVDDVMNTIKSNIQMYATYYGLSEEEFITTYMGQTVEEYEAECQTSAVEASKERLAIAAVAKKAGIVLTDEDVQAAAEAEYAEYGYETVDDLFAAVGKGAYYDYMLSDKVYEYLMNTVKINEGEPVSILAEDEYYDEEYVEDEEYAEDEDVVVIDGEEVSEDDIIVVGEDEFDEEYIEEESDYSENNTVGDLSF